MIDLDLAAVWQLWAVFAVLAVAGGFVTWRAAAAYRAHPARPLGLLAGGIGLMTLGMPAAWTISYVAAENMFVCTVASSAAVLAGAVALVASVQMRTG